MTICHSSKTEEDSKNSIIFIAIRFIILIIVWHKPFALNSGVNQIGTGKKRLNEYFAFVSAAGTKSFVQLIKDSGLNSPFEDGCVKELSTEVVQWMEQHRIK